MTPLDYLTNAENKARTEGKREGQAEEREKIVKNMISLGRCRDEDIIAYTGISSETLQEIKDSLKRNSCDS